MLLILTSKEDFAVDFLILELNKLGLPYLRLNTETFHKTQAELRLGEDYSRQIFALTGDVIDLDDVKAVYFRRAIHPTPSLELPQSERFFLTGELRHFWTGFTLGANVLWVNPPFAVYEAEHKPLQLQIAKRIGFRIPETLISSCPDTLAAFTEKYKEVICKPIYHGRFVSNEGQFSVYTRRINNEDFIDKESLSYCPILVQQEVRRRADIRVTFIGEDCFVARIFCKDESIVDWRRPDAGARYERADLPSSIRIKCKEMMKHWSLLYAAFDFIEDLSGEWIFLEVNPTGEWAWLEQDLKYSMRKSFVKMFYRQ